MTSCAARTTMRSVNARLSARSRNYQDRLARALIGMCVKSAHREQRPRVPSVDLAQVAGGNHGLVGHKIDQ